MREDPASLEEAIYRTRAAEHERDEAHAKLAEVERLTATAEHSTVTGAMRLLDAERQDLARRLEVAERELEAARAQFTAFAAGRGHLVTCEEHDAQRWWTVDGRCPHCVAAGKSGAALADVRIDIAELLRGHDELVEIRDLYAIRTRADVEARLAGADRQQVDDAIVALIEADGPDTERHAEDRLTVDLVCAVLGVPHAG